MNKAYNFSIVLSGEAGQGIQMLEHLIVQIFKKNGCSCIFIQ